MEKAKTKKIGKKLKGEVIGIVSENTIKVRVETKKPHSIYSKIIKSHKNYLVDSKVNNGEIKVGDEISINEVKPVSKSKRFAVSVK